MRKREIKLSVYLNYDEWKMLTLKAEKVGYNKSALVRSLIEGFKPKEKPSEEFYEDLNSIRKVGNILNQIARRAHYQGYIEDEKFLRKMENELQNLILNIKRKYLLQRRNKKLNNLSNFVRNKIRQIWTIKWKKMKAYGKIYS